MRAEGSAHLATRAFTHFRFSCITGGGSALLPAPTPPILLEEKEKITKLLASRGAAIQELNTIRKALSLLKGGGLARAAYPAQVGVEDFSLVQSFCSKVVLKRHHEVKNHGQNRPQ